MCNLLKSIAALIAESIISTHSFATSEDYKTIDQVDDPNTTTIHFYIKNLTSENLLLSEPSKKQIASGYPISDFTVMPKSTISLPSDHPKAFSYIPKDQPVKISEEFAYRSGEKECRFTTNITVTDHFERPRWAGKGTSTGSVPADCTTDILEVRKSFPFSYSIQFSLE